MISLVMDNNSSLIFSIHIWIIQFDDFQGPLNIFRDLDESCLLAKNKTFFLYQIHFSSGFSSHRIHFPLCIKHFSVIEFSA